MTFTWPGDPSSKRFNGEAPRYIFKLEAAKALVEAEVQKRLAPLEPRWNRTLKNCGWIRLLSNWEGNFSLAMLYFGRVTGLTHSVFFGGVFLQCFWLFEVPVQRWIESSCHSWTAQDHYFSVAMGQGFRGHWNENAVEWSKYRAPAFVDLLVSLQSVIVSLRSKIRYIPPVLKGLAITPPLVMPYPDQNFRCSRRSFHVIPLRSP